MRVNISTMVPAVLVLWAVVGCGSSSSTASAHGKSPAPVALISPGATAPIGTASAELVTLPDIQMWRVRDTETAWLGAGGCAADGCQASGQVVRLDAGATLGMVFLGPPSDPYLVLSDPGVRTKQSSDPLAMPGTVVFGPADPRDAVTVGSEDVRVKLPVLIADAGGLYLYDELGDPVCPLAAYARLAVLATDTRMGFLVQVVDETGAAVGDRGWLPVRRAGSMFRVVKPPVLVPSGQGC